MIGQLLETLIFLFCTIFVCLSGDYLVFVLLTGQEPLLKAIGDNLVHGSIALTSWLMIEKSWFHAFICALVAMLIDIDHFIQAGSFSLEDALALHQRPFLHNSTLPLVIYLTVMFVSCTVMGNPAVIKTYANVMLVAFASHHLRDASRRGLWFQPWIEALPIAYPVYIFATILICLFIKIAMFNGSFVAVTKLPWTIKDI